MNRQLSPPPRPARDPAPAADDSLLALYHQIMRIVAHLEGRPYTDSQSRQTAEWGPDDLADPASDVNTPQG